ncbi:hypothetical protein OROMI_012847 [Orobanche minor]
MKESKLGESGVCDLVDRLSALPDPVIHHIYSFLETRLMVQASMLSTRWKHLWASSRYLNFELKRSGKISHKLSKSDKQERDSFVRFVYRILVLRDASSILKFSLDSESLINVGNISTWLAAALNRNVKELHLDIATKNQHFEVPSSLFTSDITVLTLMDKLSGDNIQVPVPMCTAARIKALRLEYVRLPDGNSDGELVLSCPVLEDLTLCTCEDSHLKVFTFADFYLVDLPDLVSADIQIFKYAAGGTTEKEMFDKCLISFFRAICNVRYLKLSSENLKVIAGYPKIFEMLPNLFHNLRDFMLVDADHVDDIASISEITNVLKALTSIQVFVWRRRKGFKIPKAVNHRGEELPAQSIFECLEIVKIENSHARVDELKFLEFILERAILLKEISIRAISGDEDTIEKFRQKLLALPRTSSNVVMQTS